MEKADLNVLIIGGGYCGMAAAHTLAQQGVKTTIIESSSKLGGLSRTIHFEGCNFELGPHIYFDKDAEVTAFWKALVGDKMKPYLRNNRLYYDGKFIKSPLNIVDCIFKLGFIKIAKVFISYFKVKLIKNTEIKNAEDWVVSNFGKQLYLMFFKVYNEKIWGLKSNQIAPNWAGQRIKSSLFKMIFKSVTRNKDFIVKTFDFPDGGSDSITKAEQFFLQQHRTEILTSTFVNKVECNVQDFNVLFSDNTKRRFTHIISTIHLSDLFSVLNYDNKNTDLINAQLNALLYRNLVLVNLIFKTSEIVTFNEHWIDIHDDEIKCLRVTNFSNYPTLNTDKEFTCIGLEYNCFTEDEIWNMNDADIINIALQDLHKLKLSSQPPLKSGVEKIPKAYPVYYLNYQDNIQILFNELKKIPLLQTSGRNGLFKWNNMHHSVKTGILAAKNILGENHNLNEVKGMVTIGKDSD